ncbi:MAG: DUF1127 domain-containing protein [Paracoccaceae bacterium]
MTTLAFSTVPIAPRTSFGRIFEAVKKQREIIVTKRALSGLDDHLMRDIGLTPPTTDYAMDWWRTARVR